MPASGAEFLHRIWDHWGYLLGLLLMIEPLADGFWAGYRRFADQYISRRMRANVSITIATLALFAASFMAFRDQYHLGEEMKKQRDYQHGRAEYWQGVAVANQNKPPPTTPSAPSLSRKILRPVATKSQIADLIRLIGQASIFDKAFLDNNNAEALKAASADWGQKVIDLLDPIDHVFALRFAAAHGETVQSNRKYDLEGATLFNKNVTKIDVLTVIAKEIDDRNLEIEKENGR